MNELACRQEALSQVSSFMPRAQRDDVTIDSELAVATEQASLWPEVLVPLLHVAVVRALTIDHDVWATIDALEAEATRHNMSAMRASAMVHRLEYEANDDIVATRFNVLVEARLLLDDRSAPPRDRIAGLITLAIRLSNLRLYASAIDTLEQAMEIADEIGRPADRVTTLRMNQALTFACMALDAAEAGDTETAQEALAKVERIVLDPDQPAFPEQWALEIEAYRVLITALIGDTELDPCRVEDLIASLELDPRRIPTLLRLATPVSSWPSPPDLDNVEPRVETLAHFLHRRALERSSPDSRALAAGRVHAELLAAQAWHMRMAAGEALQAQINAGRLAKEHQTLRAQALTDQLTGTRNRRALFRRLKAHAGQPVTVFSIDLDDFKAVNDRFGHTVGDAVLQRVAGAVADQLDVTIDDIDAAADPADDVVTIARLGGDEFVVVMEGNDESRAARIAEQLTAAVNAVNWSDILGSGTQTVSIGFASGTCGAELLETSDLAMYVRKSARVTEPQPSESR